MTTFVHPTAYRFYAQRYPNGTTTYPKKDIEQTYNCRYMKFSNLVPDGDCKNSYSEDYAERSGERVYIPPKSDLAFKSYECKLKLMFKGTDALANAKQFQDDMRGIKVEYSDTFRNVYATLLMTKSMNIESERLYGSQQFVVAEYTFNNIDGVTYDSTRL